MVQAQRNRGFKVRAQAETHRVRWWREMAARDRATPIPARVERRALLPATEVAEPLPPEVAVGRLLLQAMEGPAPSLRQELVVQAAPTQAPETGRGEIWATAWWGRGGARYRRTANSEWL